MLHDIVAGESKGTQGIELATGGLVCEGDVKPGEYMSGKARVIHRHRHKEEAAQDFEEDDILVTEMTDPTMMYLVMLAKAIITDEGGPTAHAVVVSKQLHKYCVVDTEVVGKMVGKPPGTGVVPDGAMVRLGYRPKSEQTKAIAWSAEGYVAREPDVHD